MGGGTHYGPIKDHAGHCIFAYQKKGDETWNMVMTLTSALRTSLEGYSEREFRIMPLVCCSIAGMGVCYSYIPDEMIARVIPAGVPQIYSSKDVEIELGELKEADAVIKAAKEGFIKACEEGGTRHWFTRQLLMALDPINEGLTFCNAWMIQNAKARYLIDCWLEGKVMATLEKSAKDLIVPPGTGPWDALALKPHDEDEEYRCDELKTSSTHTWDNDLFIGFRFWQNYLLLHLVKFWGVRVFCYYSVGPDLKPRLKTIFAASSRLIELMLTREPVSSTQTIVRVAPKFTCFAATAYGASTRPTRPRTGTDTGEGSGRVWKVELMSSRFLRWSRTRTTARVIKRLQTPNTLFRAFPRRSMSMDIGSTM